MCWDCCTENLTSSVSLFLLISINSFLKIVYNSKKDSDISICVTDWLEVWYYEGIQEFSKVCIHLRNRKTLSSYLFVTISRQSRDKRKMVIEKMNECWVEILGAKRRVVAPSIFPGFVFFSLSISQILYHTSSYIIKIYSTCDKKNFPNFFKFSHQLNCVAWFSVHLDDTPIRTGKSPYNDHTIHDSIGAQFENILRKSWSNTQSHSESSIQRFIPHNKTYLPQH